MVDTGFDPAAFETGYKEMTGRDIHCFNFGIDASTAASTAALSQDCRRRLSPASAHHWHGSPRLCSTERGDRDPAVVLNSPWVAYRQGNFSLEGWLLEHSYLYRYRQHLGRLAQFQFEGTLWSNTKRPTKFCRMVLLRSTKSAPTSTILRSPGDNSFEVTYYTRIYSSYHMLLKIWRVLESIHGI